MFREVEASDEEGEEQEDGGILTLRAEDRFIDLSTDQLGEEEETGHRH